MLDFLRRRGYILKRIRGSHHFMRNGILCTIVPVHGSKSMKPGTLRGILTDIGLEPEDFRRILQGL